MLSSRSSSARGRASRRSRPPVARYSPNGRPRPRRQPFPAPSPGGLMGLASPTNGGRATKAQMRDRAEAVLEIVETIKPATVRQAYYQATLHGIVDKTEGGYKKVQRMLVKLRRDGRLPWAWIVDNTRWMRKPRTWDSIEDALEETLRTYRRNLWTDANAYVEVWCEKDALAGVLLGVTARWDVPLMVARGYSSITFLNEAATAMADLGRPCFIYHFGDFDPSGQNAADKIGETLREFAPGA